MRMWIRIEELLEKYWALKEKKKKKKRKKEKKKRKEKRKEGTLRLSSFSQSFFLFCCFALLLYHCFSVCKFFLGHNLSLITMSKQNQIVRFKKGKHVFEAVTKVVPPCHFFCLPNLLFPSRKMLLYNIEKIQQAFLWIAS